MGADIFFTDEDTWGAAGNRLVREAKRICGTCDVTLDCLDYAQRFHIKHGVWGGMSEKERRKARR